MTSRPDVHPRRGAKHDRAHALSPQPLERSDDTADHASTESVASALVIEDHDANLSKDFRPDRNPVRASSPSRGHALHAIRIIPSSRCLGSRARRPTLGR